AAPTIVDELADDRIGATRRERAELGELRRQSVALCLFIRRYACVERTAQRRRHASIAPSVASQSSVSSHRCHMASASSGRGGTSTTGTSSAQSGARRRRRRGGVAFTLRRLHDQPPRPCRCRGSRVLWSPPTLRNYGTF